jgi:hypothetical protein
MDTSSVVNVLILTSVDSVLSVSLQPLIHALDESIQPNICINKRACRIITHRFPRDLEG